MTQLGTNKTGINQQPSTAMTEETDGVQHVSWGTERQSSDREKTNLPLTKQAHSQEGPGVEDQTQQPPVQIALRWTTQ